MFYIKLQQKNLNGLRLDQLCDNHTSEPVCQKSTVNLLTLDLRNSTEQDVTLGLLLGEALHDLVDDSFCKLSLLVLLRLLLETDPAVKNSLKLRRESNLLALYENLVLEFGGFLTSRCFLSHVRQKPGDRTHL